MASGLAREEVITVLASPVVTNLLKNILSTIFNQSFISSIWTCFIRCSPTQTPPTGTIDWQVKKNPVLTAWSRVLLEKLTGPHLVKKFPAFYGTRRFVTAFTTARHLSVSRASWIHSIPLHPTSWRSVLILSFHLRQGFPIGLLPSGFPSKILYTPLLAPIRATCPAHLILLDFIARTIFGEEYRSFSYSLCSTREPCIDIKWIKFITKMDVAAGSRANTGCGQASRAALCGHANSDRQSTLALNL